METANIAKENLENWKEWCRLCGSLNTLEEVDLKEVNEDFFKKLLLHFFINIENLKFSSKICLDCSIFLVKVSDFNDQVQKVEQMFQEIDLTEKTEEEIDFQAIRNKYLTDSNSDQKENITSSELSEHSNSQSDCSLNVFQSDCSSNYQNKSDEQYRRKSNQYEQPEEIYLKKKSKSSVEEWQENALNEKCICPICKKELKRKNLLKNHMLTHTDEKEFECLLCKKSFRYKRNLHQHMYIHIKEKKSKCLFCSKLFRTIWSCKLHSWQMHPEEAKEFERQGKHLYGDNLTMSFDDLIEICRKIKQKGDKSSLYRRKYTLSDSETPIKCEFCSKKCKTTTGLEMHISKVHNDAKGGGIEDMEYNNNKIFNSFIDSKTNQKENSTGLKLWERNSTNDSEESLNSDFSLNYHNNSNGQKQRSISECDQSEKSDFEIESSEAFYTKSSKRFQSSERLSIDSLSHDVDFTCKPCNKVFFTKLNLEKHLLSLSHSKHISRKPFERQRKTLNEKFICPICKKEFKRSDNLKDHMLVHTDKKDFECPLCERLFRFKRNLRSHLYTHIEVKKYKCLFCSKLFRESRLCRIHSLEKHPEESKELESQGSKLYGDNFKMPLEGLIETCRKMKQEGYKSYLYRRKIKTSHSENPVNCEICSQKCKSIAGLDLHIIKTHVNPKKRIKDEVQICPICTKKLKNKLYLRNHMRIHSDNKDFVCSECGGAYTTKSILRHHMKIMHSKVYKPYECYFCHAMFSLRSELKIHKEENHSNDEKENTKQEILFDDEKKDYMNFEHEYC